MRLIDADAMMKHLEDLLCGDCDTPRKEGWCDVCDYAFLMSEMKKEPTVELKHGHWIFNPKDAIEMMFTLPTCSECGAKSSDGGNYCHNCGAKMDRVKNETN